MLNVGVVGHRSLGDAETSAFVAQQCLDILKQLQDQHTDVTALSAIAAGADTLFAEAALALDIPLDIVHPFEGYASDFAPTHARKRYERLRAAARTESRLSYPGRSKEAYQAAMNWIVERSDVLIAAWNGLPSEGVGGTGDAVEQAILTNRAWIHLNIVDLSVTFHVLDVAVNELGGE